MNGEGGSQPVATWAALVLAVLGMLGSVGGAWAMFEGRISKVEQSYQFSDARLTRIEMKIDSLNDKMIDEARRGGK